MSANVVQRYTYDAYGNAIGFDPATALTLHLYNSEAFDPLTGFQQLDHRPLDLANGRFPSFDPILGDFQNPISLNKYLYAGSDGINLYDPTGMYGEGLGGQMVIAGARSALSGMAVGAVIRGFSAGVDLYHGATWRDVALEFAGGILQDAALGFVLGGAATGIVRAVGSNAFKIRALGQSVAAFKNLRLPGSAWLLNASQRGFQIEKHILNRAASFSGRIIQNFPVIDDYVLTGGRGFATSIKSLDLTRKTYQTTSAITSRLNTFATKMQNFAKTQAVGPSSFKVGGSSPNMVTDRILVVAFEEGAANSAQSAVMLKFLREAPAKFPDVKVIFQFIP